MSEETWCSCVFNAFGTGVEAPDPGLSVGRARLDADLVSPLAKDVFMVTRSWLIMCNQRQRTAEKQIVDIRPDGSKEATLL